jgi:hypothetical protein
MCSAYLDSRIILCFGYFIGGLSGRADGLFLRFWLHLRLVFHFENRIRFVLRRVRRGRRLWGLSLRMAERQRPLDEREVGTLPRTAYALHHSLGVARQRTETARAGRTSCLKLGGSPHPSRCVRGRIGSCVNDVPVRIAVCW